MLDLYLLKNNKSAPEDFIVIQKFVRLGMDIYQWDKDTSNSVLFVTVQANKYKLFKALLGDIKETDEGKIKRQHKLKSANSEGLADMLIDKYPDFLEVEAVINNYELAYKLSDLKPHTGLVYTVMKLAQWSKNHPNLNYKKQQCAQGALL